MKNTIRNLSSLTFLGAMLFTANTTFAQTPGESTTTTSTTTSAGTVSQFNPDTCQFEIGQLLVEYGQAGGLELLLGYPCGAEVDTHQPYLPPVELKIAVPAYLDMLVGAVGPLDCPVEQVPGLIRLSDLRKHGS